MSLHVALAASPSLPRVFVKRRLALARTRDVSPICGLLSQDIPMLTTSTAKGQSRRYNPKLWPMRTASTHTGERRVRKSLSKLTTCPRVSSTPPCTHSHDFRVIALELAYVDNRLRISSFDVDNRDQRA
jgi:hypothetical protein